jgi:hypothetical protein
VKPLYVFLSVALVGALLWQGYQSRHDAVWKADKAMVLAQASHDKATADSLRKFADGLQERAKDAERVAERNNRMAIASRKDTDSILGLLNTSRNGSDSAEVALRALETLRVGMDSLQAGYEA